MFLKHRGDAVIEQDAIIHTVFRHYADTQAIYLFGSYGTDDEWPDSDVDIRRSKQERADRWR